MRVTGATVGRERGVVREASAVRARRPRRATFVVWTRALRMADQDQKKETGGLLFLLAGVAGVVFLLTIAVIWALAYGPLS